MSGNFVLGAGYNLNKSNAISGEFLWTGLPSNLFVVSQVKAPTSNINLCSPTVNYRRQFDRISGSPFGVYFIGGGRFHRYISIDKNYIRTPATRCQPYWYWYGYGCYEGAVYSRLPSGLRIRTCGSSPNRAITTRSTRTSRRRSCP